MKILIVDHSTDVQQRWMDPLRREGWGVFRARNSDDATKMLAFHAKSLNYVIASEQDVEWAEKSNFPFILITKNWTDQQIIQHKKSKRAAIAYFPRTITAMEMKAAIEARKSMPVAAPLQATASLSLENFGDVLSKPEVTKTSTLSNIRLRGPNVFLGGVDAPPSNEPEDFNLEPVVAAPPPAAKPIAAPVTQNQPQPASLQMETSVGIMRAQPAPTGDSTRVMTAIPAESVPQNRPIEITLNRPMDFSPSSPNSAEAPQKTVIERSDDSFSLEDVSAPNAERTMMLDRRSAIGSGDGSRNRKLRFGLG
jgi:hypothetical protein